MTQSEVLSAVCWAFILTFVIFGIAREANTAGQLQKAKKPKGRKWTRRRL